MGVGVCGCEEHVFVLVPHGVPQFARKSLV